MAGKGLMLQGTASSVGKSILAAALCRVFTQDGYRVSPFKSQNMSLNSYITPEGHEMGRAQVMQAEAAGKAPCVRMNPILLKPTSDRKSQVIINGSVYDNMDATDYFAFKPQLKEEIKNIYWSLADENDIVVIEGAGSPAEINLKENDIVNMGMAEIAQSPVILIGDIDKGGVFASLYGTVKLMTPKEQKRIKGVIINKFRGSVEILEPGLKQLEALIGIPVLGVIPYFQLDLEDEDSVTDWSKYTKNQQGDLDVAVVKMPKISNFTDFNALTLQKDVNLRFVDLNESLGQPDIVILPGSKSTVCDLEKLKQTGMDQQIIDAYKRGSFVFGICGGYQMLGREIQDPMGVETTQPSTTGLGLLDVVTIFEDKKITTLSEGTDRWFGQKIQGYEIHMGRTVRNKENMDAIDVTKQNSTCTSHMDGAISQDKKVYGTYFHGIFDNGAFTKEYLDYIREKRGKKPIEREVLDYWVHKEKQYDCLAEIVRNNIDMKRMYEIMEEGTHD